MKFRKKVFLTLMILLALAGIPVVPPKKIEMDVDDKIKTEIEDGSEKD